MERALLISSLKNLFDRQLESNKEKNIFFYPLHDSMQIYTLSADILSELQQLDLNCLEELAGYAVEKTSLAFGRINQYYTIDEPARVKLREIYLHLIDRMRNLNAAQGAPGMVNILRDHHENLQHWLKHTNPFASQINPAEKQAAAIAPCFEYESAIQMNGFQISPNDLVSPLLDIGCGKNAFLVKYLRKTGIDAFGIDRFATIGPFCSRSDWIQYNYGKDKWGVVISHLGFSNHFFNHHQRADGKIIDYTHTYMSILDSLQPGGHFYYVPHLPFIEQHLNGSVFNVENNRFGQTGFHFTKITKIMQII